MTVTNPLRGLGRFIVNYWFWILCLLAVNGAVSAGAEYLYHHTLRAQPGELWAVRMYLASGLLLFDNLCVLWWYADSTKQQLALAQVEFKESQRQRLVSQKPVVYTERVEDPERAGHVSYFIRNAGGGPAVNVYYIGLFDLAFGQAGSLGALAAGDARLLPRGVGAILREGDAGIRYVLVAESLYTRTTQWNPTLNVRTQTAGRHGGQVLYRTAEPAIPPPRFQYQSLRDYLANNNGSFAEQLMAFAREEAGE